MQRADIEDVYQLSPLQQGMLFHHLQGGADANGGDVYVVQFCLSLAGPLDPRALAEAWERVLALHPALRTSFHWEKLQTPTQVVHRQVKLPVESHDWQGRDGQADLPRFLAEERSRGFDLTRPPLLRLAILRTGPEENVLVWTHHHLLLDGWSVALVVGQVLTLYEALVRGSASDLERSRPFRDYVAWLRRQDLEETERFWRRELAGFAAPTPLGAREPLPGRSGFEESLAQLDPAATAALQALARGEQLTVNTLAQGAWALLLSRHGGERDVLFGITVSGRPASLPGVESMVGLFINTLPLRVAVEPGDPLRPWLRRLQERQAEIRQHEHSPLFEVQRWSAVPRGTPLFHSLLVFENFPTAAERRTGPTSVEIRDVRLVEASNYPLTLAVTPGRGPGAELGLRAIYDRARFTRVEIRRLQEHLLALLRSLAADPTRRLGEIPMLSAAEQHQVLVEWNDTAIRLPEAEGIHGLFEQWAAQAPEASALSFGEYVLTYGELDRRAERLARDLRGRGVGPGAIVGLPAGRSPGLILGLLAILKAGGAYLPLDPAQPRERLELLLADSGAQSGDGPGLNLGPEPLHARDSRDEGPRWSAGPDDLAYVMYTSGSTGRPKGVEVRHEGILRLVRPEVASPIAMGPGEVWLQLAPAAFDASTLEIWAALANGGHLVLLAEETPSLEDVAGAIQRHGVTSLWLTAGLFQQMVDRGLGDLVTLRQLLAGGDVLSAVHVEEALRQLPGVRLINGYGPTENTVFTACHRLEAPVGASAPIGRPLPGTRIHLLDGDLRPVPVGAPGRLFTGGLGLARGYLRRPDLTAERFVPDPFGPNPFAMLEGRPGERLYDTGDLARLRPDGVLEFLGRTDAQVKIRGYRVEPGEVEAVLSEHPGIAGAVVLARPDPTRAGSRRLVAWIVALPSLEASPGSALRTWLAARLPEPLIPSAFVALDALPLTANGKVDRGALPTPEESRPAGEVPFAGPRTPVEEILAQIWSEVLGAERVGIDEDFFALGGHSLGAIQVVSRIRRTLDVELPLRTLFESPTVLALARQVEALRRQREAAAEPPLVRMPREGDLPLSFAQQRLWFLDRLEPGQPAYNIPLALRLSGEIDPRALAGALTALAARHESLRTTFPDLVQDQGGEPVQCIAAAPAVALPVLELSGLPEAPREAEARRLAEAEALAPFDLARGPLLRTRLVRLAARDHLLLLTLHHIVSDAWSMGVLVQDLIALYRAEGLRNGLPALPLQYADYTLWQRQKLQGEALEGRIAWWRERLAGAPALLDLPLDRPRPPVRGTRGASLPFALPAGLSAAVRALGARHGATLHMTWLAALAALLARYGCGDDLPIGTTVAGRERRELEDLIGFFVNTLVLRVDAAGDPPVSELVKRARETALAAYARQDLPFEKLVAELQPERDLSHGPLFQVLLAVQNAPEPAAELPGLTVSPVIQPVRTARFDLSLTVLPTEPLSGNLTYAADLFAAVTAGRLLAHLAVLLAAMAAEPSLRLSELPLLTAAEEAQILAHWSGAGSEPAARDRTVHEMLALQAERTPLAPAVRFRDEVLTFRELEARAGRLARHLRGRGVGPDVPVALLLKRSADLLPAVFGILAAGGAFVPFDPATPPRRLELLLEDCGAPVLVTQQSLLSRLPEAWRGERTVCVDRDLSGGTDSAPLSRVFPENLCYVIYTSGSTGSPKGVQVQHASVVNLAAALQRTIYAGQAPGLRVALNATLAFDGAIKQVIQVLSGHCVEVLSEEIRLDAEALPAYLEEHGVDVLDCTPSQLRAFLEGQGAGLEGGLSLGAGVTLLVGGEALDEATRERLAAGRSASWNVYGPTECTVDTTVGCIEAGPGPVSIGRPVAGAAVYVLDPDLRPVPAGMVGHLHVAGAGLARGYLGRPDLTAERFRPDPFGAGRGEPGSRLYATGDLGRWLPDGRIELRGRTDHQVKVRGVRIELGEIESVLAQAPGVREAAVVVVLTAAPAEPRLVAWLATGGEDGRGDGAEGDSREADLRAWLRDRLPATMMPADLLWHPGPLPRTPSGKLDRQALEQRAQERPAARREHVPPGDLLTQRLAAIWSDLLRVEPVGLTDSFFGLGGHSLLVTRLAVRIRRELGAELPLRTLFEAATLEEMAQAVLRQLLAVEEDPRDLLAELDGMTEEEANALLEMEDEEEALGGEAAAAGSPGGLRSEPAAEPAAKPAAQPMTEDTGAASGSGREAPAPEPRRSGHGIVPVPRDRPLPATFYQEWGLELDGAEFNGLPSAFRVAGDLQRATLQRSLTEVARRHESLRTSFRVEGGEAFFAIAPPAEVPLPLVDLQGLRGEPRARELQRLVAQQSVHAFDLARGPLFIAWLVQLGPEEHALLLNAHHLVSDGWSNQVLLRELTVLYTAFDLGRSSPLPPLPIQLADFASWQRQVFARDGLPQQLAWWRRTLANLPPPPELPGDRERPGEPSMRSVDVTFKVPFATTRALSALAQEVHCSLSMVLLAAVDALLHAYSGQEDLIVSLILAGRTRPELAGQIGLFMNTVALRADLSGNPSFRQLAERLRDATIEAYAHQDVPFPLLLRELFPKSKLTRTLISGVCFNMLGFADPAGGPPQGGAGPEDPLAFEPLPLKEEGAKHDLVFLCSGGALHFALKGAADLFTLGRLRSLAEDFQSLLVQVATDPETPLARLRQGIRPMAAAGVTTGAGAS